VTPQSQFAITAVGAACAYYLFAWLLFARGRKLGAVFPLYDPPRQLSPAMLRYIWKQRFDDRTFWAGVLSLVAKGFAILHSGTHEALIRATSSANTVNGLPKEEEILFKDLVRGHTRKDAPIEMLNVKTKRAIREMAESLRREALGRWFIENRRVVIAGTILSTAALALAASPRNKAEWGALALGLAVMAPGAFYLFFISMRV
jgi:hypothetical protein